MNYVETMSDTPRTNAVCITPILGPDVSAHKWEMLQKLARALERENAALREALGYALPLAMEAAGNEPAGASNGLTFKRLNAAQQLLSERGSE